MNAHALVKYLWVAWLSSAAITACACAVVLWKGLGRRVEPARENPFHISGQKLIAGLVPVVVGSIVALAVMPNTLRVSCVLVTAVLALALVGRGDDVRRYTPLAKVGLQLPVFVFLTLTVPPFPEPETAGARVVAHLAHVVFLLVATNALNVLDVADALVPSVTAISLATTTALLCATGDAAGSLVAASFGGAAVGFLSYNSAGEVILGDAGSLAFGGLLATLAPLGWTRMPKLQPIGTALLLFVPIVETVWLTLRRALIGVPPWRATPHHLAFSLMNRGVSAKKAVGVIVAVQVLAAAAAIWVASAREGSTWLLVGVAGVLVSQGFGICKRRVLISR